VLDQYAYIPYKALLHLQHNMPHRSTKWRWKKNGRPASPHSGRQLKQKAREQRTRKLLIGLLNEKFPRVPAKEFQRWLNESLQDGNPIDLIAVAAHDVLCFGRRTRRPDKRRLAKLLMAEYPKLTKQQALELVQSGGEWLKYFDRSGRRIDEIHRPLDEEDSPCCVSRIFTHVSRRMACYWRQHPDYKHLARDLCSFWLAERLGPSSGPAPTRAEKEAERLARKGVQPSSWREPHFL
jgi:hypothetical protein